MNNFFFKIKHLRNKTKIKGKKAKKKKVKVEPFVDEADMGWCGTGSYSFYYCIVNSRSNL
jgi:hypothetical protein